MRTEDAECHGLLSTPARRNAHVAIHIPQKIPRFGGVSVSAVRVTEIEKESGIDVALRTPPWPSFPACPCGCLDKNGEPVTGLKLAAKSGHLARLCECISCRNRRNQKRGKRGEYNRHRRLKGGARFTPNDELGYVYSIEFVTQDKAGAQIPASFLRFSQSEWTRRALKQALMTIPEGVVAYPALYLEPPGGGWWLVVKGE